MTEITKPGASTEIASMPYVFQLKTHTVVINTLSICLHTFVTPSNLKISLKVPKEFAFQEKMK